MAGLRIVMLAASSIFLFEGLMFSLFPEQVLAMLRETEPRTLQIAGLVETLVAASLLGSLLFGA